MLLSTPPQLRHHMKPARRPPRHLPSLPARAAPPRAAPAAPSAACARGPGPPLPGGLGASCRGVGRGDGPQLLLCCRQQRVPLLLQPPARQGPLGTPPAGPVLASRSGMEGRHATPGRLQALPGPPPPSPAAGRASCCLTCEGAYRMSSTNLMCCSAGSGSTGRGGQSALSALGGSCAQRACPRAAAAQKGWVAPCCPPAPLEAVGGPPGMGGTLQAGSPWRSPGPLAGVSGTAAQCSAAWSSRSPSPWPPGRRAAATPPAVQAAGGGGG